MGWNRSTAAKWELAAGQLQNLMWWHLAWSGDKPVNQVWVRTASDKWSHLSELGQCGDQSTGHKVTVKHKRLVCYGNMSPTPPGLFWEPVPCSPRPFRQKGFCCFSAALPDLSMQFAALAAKRHRTPKAAPKLWGAAPGHSLNRVSRRIMQAMKPSKSMLSWVLQA